MATSQRVGDAEPQQGQYPPRIASCRKKRRINGGHLFLGWNRLAGWFKNHQLNIVFLTI